MMTATSILLVLAMTVSSVAASPYTRIDTEETPVQTDMAETAEVIGASMEDSDSGDASSGDTSDDEIVSINSSADHNGELHLTIHRKQVSAETTFTVTLQSENGSNKTTSFTAGADSKDSILLDDIVDGIYTLTVSAPYYLTYTQQLEFKGQCVRLDLYNYITVNEGRSDNNGGCFGVMPVGDMNGDGQINDDDADMVTAAAGTSDNTCDINGDGKVDVEDIAIVVRNSGSVVQATPVNTLSTAVLAENVEVSVSENTRAEGDPSVILNQLSNGSYLTLLPASDEKINADNPVGIVLDTDKSGSGETSDSLAAEAIVIAPPANSENYMTAGVVEVEGTDIKTGDNVTVVTTVSNNDISDTMTSALMDAGSVKGTSDVESSGNVVINLGSRVAIKKITIRVTDTANQNNLAEIATVEFLENFAERIPEPQLSIPVIKSVSNTPTDGQGYKNLSVEWSSEPNVTGYEVSVSGKGYNKTASTSDNSYTFQGDSFNGSVLSFNTYNVRIRSVSGDWKSDWSDVYTHTVTCSTVPPAPQYLTATAGVQSLNVSWNCKYDAEGYTLYYKKSDDSEYQSVGGIETDGDGNRIFTLTGSEYTLSGLTGGAEYTMYVVAHNRNGSSPKSSDISAMPTTPDGVEMPEYKLINTDNEDGMALTHITGISGNSNKSYTIYKSDGTTVTNSIASPADWNVLLDNDPCSYVYIDDWDSGAVYDNFRGPIIQMDDYYTMDTIRMSPNEGFSVHMNTVKIKYNTEDGTFRTANTRFYTRYDSQNRRYYEVILEEPITTNYLEIRTGTGYSRNYTICEVKLYRYDPIENDVTALFSDSMRTALYDNVTEEQIQELIDRVNIPDEVSGELHPHRDTILNELNYAMQLLHDGAAAKIIAVDNQITATGNPSSGFAQALSDYQPLGIVAAAGDTVVIYVSGGDVSKGNAVKLNLIASQYHPEVANWQKTVVQLKAGRNEITIPRIGSYAKESGGSLYLQYTGARGEYDYQVRVSGGTEIPTLNLDGITGGERTDAIKIYAENLEKYVGRIRELHEILHTDSDNTYVGYEYSDTECFLNSTEITLENMMYSVPALEVWNTIKSDPVNKLSNSIAAMEQEIDYFYQFKGLNKNASDKDAYPYTRLNIRYHQMFTGAFMYAGGKHIGIEYGSVGSLFSTSPVITDENGRYESGSFSGWGIAHEIGHCINAADYQRVEVTNNIFAQLANTGNPSTSETNSNFRTGYDKVYKAVASGTTGHTGDLAVQLAMYWQLHLAYDDDYAYKVYDSIEEQQESLFYARLESYLRDRTKAKYDLPASSSGDQLFMQAACAAADKNILNFFKAWGFTPDPITYEYASNFDTEPRKIQYIDDDSRLYRIEGGKGMSEDTRVTASVTNAVNSRINDNKVNIELSNTNTDDNSMLGYEICRNGKVVAFVTASQSSYTDIVTTENNRALIYTVTGIDRLLNQTETLVLQEIKVCHDGAIDKSGWTASTNMTSPKDTAVEKNENDPESGVVSGTTKPGTEKISDIGVVLDNNKGTVYYGTTVGGKGNRPYVILNMGGVEQVSALKFTPASKEYDGDAAEGTGISASDLYKYRLFDYKIEVSTDGITWTTVKESAVYSGAPAANNPDTWNLSDDIIANDDGSYTMYFNRQSEDGTADSFMYTYDAAYVKLTSANMSAMAVAEIDILGPTSDNIELITDGFGRLKKSYNAGNYADGTPCVIPTGSVVFFGSYRGDPSYNAVILRNQNRDVLDGSQLFFADVPQSGELGQTSDGRWIFWLENDDKIDSMGDKYNEYDQLDGLETVQAELYRVQDAMTMAGQRITSTTLTMTVPDEIPDAEITDNFMDTKSVTFTPVSLTADAMVNMADTKAADVSSVLAASYNSYYGDTGAMETGKASPVRFSVDGNKVNIAVNPDEIAIAMTTDIIISPVSDIISTDILNKDDNLYQAYKYNDGVLTLYAVARSGNIGGIDDDSVILNYAVTGMASENILTAGNIYELESGYTSIEKTVPEDYSITFSESLGYNIVYQNGCAVVTASEGTECCVIFAAYDENGSLTSMAVEENITIGSSGTETIPSPSEFNASGTVKVMLWNSLDNMKPLCRTDI